MNESGETNFQTPNPEELKKAAAEDPIHEREGAKETNIVENVSEGGSANLENSQTIISSLGGQ
jgi:hypothetical protein